MSKSVINCTYQSIFCTNQALDNCTEFGVTAGTGPGTNASPSSGVTLQRHSGQWRWPLSSPGLRQFGYFADFFEEIHNAQRYFRKNEVFKRLPDH